MGNELKVFLGRLWPVLVVLVIIPVASYVVWWLFPTQELNILVVDKTVPNQRFGEHHGLFWALEYDKIVKEDNSFYEESRDYFGYFPNVQERKKGTVQDLSKHSEGELIELAKEADVLYLTDTYGVYENDFDEVMDPDEFSNKVYGGLDQKEINLLAQAKKQEKVIIAEYNTMASPTTLNNRAQFELLMGLKWTGWIARYFDELDTLANDELPNWLVNNYLEQNDEQWGFVGPGLVFVHETGEIEIFRQGVEFEQTVPLIRTQHFNKPEFKLPEIVPYPDWFEVVFIDRGYEVISYFDIGPTAQGMERLKEMGLPRFFPAAVVQNNGKGQQYYFTGDFSDMRQNLGSAHFKGLPFLFRGLYSPLNYRDRQSFFWNYYLPLIRQILDRVEK
ncbi:hypothetical protein [Algoriphagus vanfongensis]|uniref:hypothetical protein n=1 Tax=Algoriphagus vanfongensis TaxID=426371 RepID=UPI000400A76F|nr:hypothetical protein [Algoriphagus vanfongensis]